MGNVKRGFTLIELLVVIAIIAILAAILFPVFAKARASARQISCLSSMKQVGFAVLMYTKDNSDMMPPYENSVPYPDRKMWYDFCKSYLKKGQVFRCPELPAAGAAIDPNNNYYWSRLLGFGANYLHALSPTWGSGGVPKPGKSINTIKNQSRTLLLADASDLGCMNSGDALAGQGQQGFPVVYCKFCFPSGTYDTKYNSVALRHNRGANVYFVDGHAKWYRIEDVLSTVLVDNMWGHPVP